LAGSEPTGPPFLGVATLETYYNSQVSTKTEKKSSKLKNAAVNLGHPASGTNQQKCKGVLKATDGWHCSC